jgi:ferredoxin
MPHVVTGRCVSCRYTDCAAVCPSDSFHLVESPAMLVINPESCIDCGLCIPECPVYAIYAGDEVPPEYREWVARNGELASKGKMINARLEALASAITLELIHQRERDQGWQVPDPSDVAGKPPKNAKARAATPAPAAPGAPPSPPAGAKPPEQPPAGEAPGDRPGFFRRFFKK